MTSSVIPEVKQKFLLLVSFLREKKSGVLAFSGGVDSSFLLKAMKIADMRALAVTAVSETVPKNDISHAIRYAADVGAEHRIIRTEELRDERFVNNPPERCYYCKAELFKRIKVIAEQENYRYVFDGSNADDLNDYRPGRKAAERYGVVSPLIENNFTKEEIRLMARDLDLNIWNRPSSPCLSSRIPYGQRITQPALRMVEKAEEFLRKLGFHECRVRHHGDTARIEISESDIPCILDTEKRHMIAAALRSFGYDHISLDLEGYRSGNMNKAVHRCTMQRED